MISRSTSCVAHYLISPVSPSFYRLAFVRIQHTRFPNYAAVGLLCALDRADPSAVEPIALRSIGSRLRDKRGGVRREAAKESFLLLKSINLLCIRIILFLFQDRRFITVTAKNSLSTEHAMGVPTARPARLPLGRQTRR